MLFNSIVEEKQRCWRWLGHILHMNKARRQHVAMSQNIFRHGNWPRISVGKNKCPPKKIKWSTEKKFRKKMQGCFMQFLLLIFVKKLQLQGASPPDPHLGHCPWTPTGGVAPWTPTGGLLRPPGPHFSADFSILNSHAWSSWYSRTCFNAISNTTRSWYSHSQT